MAPSKRNQSATLAKSPPGSPIRPITKRPRQKTPESQASSSTSATLHLPLRPTKPNYTSILTTFNSSQIDSESEEERAQAISESKSEIKEEDDDIACNNEYLD
ncbi:hypothetical protein DL95DRAFT_471925 [Leptodontidium sp. 2 PMI_412]|nr:hypothetical protein DL95DRAFT_471925 [Leptodontidium sp. 2 PMI_412]